MDNLTNEQLVTQYHKGDERAFAELVQRTLGLVYGICLRYLQNRSDAEDASQETFVKIWSNVKKFSVDRNFETWAAHIAKNTCLDVLRKKKIIPFSAFINASGDNILAEVLPSNQPEPGQLTDRSLMARILNAAIHTLPPRHQKVLFLYYADGLNFREIAEHLKQPLHTIKSRHRRAVISLKKLIKEN